MIDRQSTESTPNPVDCLSITHDGEPGYNYLHYTTYVVVTLTQLLSLSQVCVFTLSYLPRSCLYCAVCFRMFTADSVRSVLLKIVEAEVGWENRSKELVLLTLCLPIIAHCLPPFSWLHTRLFFSRHLNKLLQ